MLEERYKETNKPSVGDIISFSGKDLQHTGTIVKVANEITFFHQDYGSPFSVTTSEEYKKRKPSFDVHYHTRK